MIPLPGLVRQFLVSTLTVVSCGWSFVPARPRTVAVLDFKGRGVSREFADSVADRLSQALRETGRFEARDRDSVSGSRDHGRGGGFIARCHEWDCAIRAGRVLQVDRVVIGAVDAEGSALVLTTRMMDVEREAPLGKFEFRTDRGAAEAKERGTVSLASQFTAQEQLFASSAAAGPSANPLDTLQLLRAAKMEKELRLWRRTAGTTAIVGGVALLVGGAMFVGNSTACVFSGEGPCKEPDRTAQNVWITSGVLLEGVAIVSGIAAIGRSRELRDLRKKSPPELSWTPLVDPNSGAVGLATRWEF